VKQWDIGGASEAMGQGCGVVGHSGVVGPSGAVEQRTTGGAVKQWDTAG
jgi:hypothetical protein